MAKQAAVVNFDAVLLDLEQAKNAVEIISNRYSVHLVADQQKYEYDFVSQSIKSFSFEAVCYVSEGSGLPTKTEVCLCIRPKVLLEDLPDSNTLLLAEAEIMVFILGECDRGLKHKSILYVDSWREVIDIFS